MCLIHCWSTQILWSETIVAVYTAVYFAEGPPFPGRRSVNGCLTTQQRRSASPAQNHASPSLSSERVLDAKTVPACPALCRAVLPRFKPCVPRPAGECRARDRHGLKRDNRGRHDAREAGTVLALRTRSRTARREKKSGAAPERHVGVVVSSRTRSRNGG
jgi:hypothetical protein